jgi:hypothetical protein
LALVKSLQEHPSIKQKYRLLLTCPPKQCLDAVLNEMDRAASTDASFLKILGDPLASALLPFQIQGVR